MHRRTFLGYALIFVTGAGILGVGSGCREKATTPESDATPVASVLRYTPPDLRNVDGPTPNIIFVLIDTLRADRLGAYGSSLNLTPTLDAIASESVVAERCFTAAPWTQPAVASLFCSRYPGVHKVRNFAQAVRQTVLGQPKVPVFGASFVTLAEWLLARGYATAGIVANPFILREFGFAQGFEFFDTSHTGNDVGGENVNASAFVWLTNRDPDKPFFLYLHYMDVHGPYPIEGAFLDGLLDEVERNPDKHTLTEAEFRNLGYLREAKNAPANPERHNRLGQYREYWEARYNAGVHAADRAVASLRTRLTEMGFWDDAFVIIASDHGEQLCERGQWDHGLSMYNTELATPLIMRWPGHLPAGSHLSANVRLIDVLPTVLDLLELPGDPLAQGSSLRPLLQPLARDGATNKMPSEPRLIFAESTRIPPEQKAVLYGPWKLIRFVGSDRRELYNLRADPGEHRNLAAKDPETLATLRTLLDDQLRLNEKMAQGIEPKQTTVTQEQLNRLRSLGYLGD